MNDMPELRPIEESDYYAVSADGTVWSRHVRGHSSRAGQWAKLKTAVNSHGYGIVSIRDSGNGISREARVHILVAKAFVPNPLGKPYVNHIDGDKMNNRSHNLEWVTASENTLHAVRSGLFKQNIFGARHYRSKLSEEQVWSIKLLHKGCGIMQKKLASMFGVSKATISDICCARTRRRG